MSLCEKCIVPGRTGATVGQDSRGGYACVCVEGGLQENFIYLLLITVSCKTKIGIKKIVCLEISEMVPQLTQVLFM